MKVVVTGAGGNLGRVVIPALEANGHAVRAADIRPLDAAGHEVMRADLRDPEDAARAVAGVDAVVHAAALHGVHLSRFAPHDFWSTNVTATFNVFEAAAAEGINRFVLCSTMGVYGETAQRTDEAWAVVTEESPTLPTDVYGLSKLLCEQMARYYGRVAGVATTALRLGMFVPETYERYGFRLLFGGVDDRDVAQAVLLALAHEPRGGFDCFNVMADTPFAPDDAEALAADPAALIEQRWPGTAALLAARRLSVDDLVWGWAIWSVEKAKRELGYRPRHNFDEFLDALRAGNEAYYPYAGLPQWGVD